MKPYSRIQKITAFSLILLFSLQAGAGLWLHSTLHTHPVAKTPATGDIQLQPAQQAVSFSCSCTDFFLSGFIGIGAVNVLHRPVSFRQQRAVFFNTRFVSAVRSYVPLRGPPVIFS